MPFRLNPIVDQGEFDRHNNTEQYYMDQLRKKGLLLEIDNVFADAEQLILRTFQCNTNYCIRCTGHGADMEYKGSCCTDLSVDLTRHEMDKLKDMAEQAKAKLDFDETNPVGKIVDRVLAGKVTEVNEDHELVFLHKNNGTCAMSWFDPSGQFRCAINTLCMELDLSIPEYKPDPCFLFPLHYTEIGKGTYLLSMLTEETRSWIDQHAVVGKLRCLRKPEPGSPPAYTFLRGELEYVFGKEFYKILDELAQPILERHFSAAATNGAAI